MFSSWCYKTLHNTDACSFFKTVTETWLTKSTVVGLQCTYSPSFYTRLQNCESL